MRIYTRTERQTTQDGERGEDENSCCGNFPRGTRSDGQLALINGFLVGSDDGLYRVEDTTTMIDPRCRSVGKLLFSTVCILIQSVLLYTTRLYNYNARCVR